MKKSSRFDFLANFLWYLKFIYKHKPKSTFFKLLTDILLELRNLAVNAANAFLVNSLALIYIGVSEAELSEKIIHVILIYVLYICILKGAQHLNRFSTNQLRVSMGYDPTSALYENLKDKGVEYQENPKTINAITRYKENSWIFRDLIDYFGAFIGIIVAIITSILILQYFGWGYILFCLLIAFPLIIVNRIFIKKLYIFDIENTDKRRNAFGNASYLTDPKSFKEVIQINGYDYLKSIFARYSIFAQNFNTQLRTKWYIYSFVLSGLEVLLIIITLNILIFDVYNGLLEPGTAIFYFSTSLGLFSGVNNLTSNITSVSEQLMKLKDARDIFIADKSQEDGTKKVESLTPKTIEFRDVSFKYPNSNRYVLKNFNLKIEAGEEIAIVGHNGAGKSTLIKLISRIHKPTSGEILINGQNLNDITPSSWNDNLGVLFQDFNTYEHLTLRENVAIGNIKRKIVDSEIWDALKNADAKDFAKEYLAGLDTVLSEKYKGGIRPSTGQWQKIAIARFFYRNAPILILDEPTASIDAVAEANIFDRIYKFITNKTVIIVSHRFSTVRNAKRIIVFEKGQIIEEGSHSELLKKNGMYTKAFNLQAKGYSSESID